MEAIVFQRERTIEARAGVYGKGAYMKIDFVPKNGHRDELAIHVDSLEQLIAICQTVAIEARNLLDEERLAALHDAEVPEMLSLSHAN